MPNSDLIYRSHRALRDMLLSIVMLGVVSLLVGWFSFWSFQSSILPDWSAQAEQMLDLSIPFQDIALGLAIALPILMLLMFFYGWYYYRYEITEHKVRVHEGVLAKQVIAVNLRAIHAIEVRQSLYQRMVGIGDVEILTAASTGRNAEQDHTTIVFYGVPTPHKVRQLILQKNAH